CTCSDPRSVSSTISSGCGPRVRELRRRSRGRSRCQSARERASVRSDENRRHRRRPAETGTGARARGALPEAFRRDRPQARLPRAGYPRDRREPRARGESSYRRRGDRNIGRIPENSVLVTLDEHGDNIDSATLARLLGRWRDQAVADTIFAIGGADGLSPDLQGKAKFRVAFGAATWPHQMVRVMLLEQLYRASTILAGHPYHRA